MLKILVKFLGQKKQCDINSPPTLLIAKLHQHMY